MTPLVSTHASDRNHSDRTGSDLDISVVIPVYNEGACLPELQQRLTAVVQEIGRSYEIIYVDDGSSDDSLALVRAYAGADRRVRFLSFTRNFGQAAAITAGQSIARGRAVVCLDADLQNPPEEIPKLLARFDEGFEIVYGVRRDRRDPWLRRLGSAVIAKIVRIAVGTEVNPNVTAFSITHRRIVDAMNRCPERTQFQPVLAAWLGAKTSCVDVAHSARVRGTSKYGYWKLLQRAFDLVTAYTQLPLRVASLTGIVFAVFGFAMAGWAVSQKLMTGEALLGWATTLSAIGILGGAQLLAIGTIGEYVGRAYTQVLQRPLFVVRESSADAMVTGVRQADAASVVVLPAGQACGRFVESGISVP